MSLGVHFALSLADAKRVRELEDPEELAEFISEDLEERYLDSGTWAFETDKSWDAIHRCLTDGSLDADVKRFPLALAVLGGSPLELTDGCVARLVEPEDVRRTAAALAAIEKGWLRDRYSSLSSTDYDGPIGDDDFEYTWENLEGLTQFFAKAAKGGRPVLFTTS